MAETTTNEYRPSRVSPPGDTLLETLESVGMSQAELAERTGRPKKTINEIIKGKTAITPETALQLEKVLDIPASFWNTRERNYREALAKEDEKRSLERHLGWLREFPVKAMVKWKWIEPKDNEVDQLRELLKFFGISSPRPLDDLARDVCYRRSAAFQQNRAACIAWLRRGIIEAQRVTCEPYDPARFKTSLVSARALTRQRPEDFASNLTSLLAQAGVAVVFVPELPKIRLWEATRWINPEKALIQLCLRYKTADHLWFSFYHGAGHVYLHNKRAVFIESEQDDPEKEKEADEFAKELLVSREAFQKFASGADFTRTAIRNFAEKQGIAPGIIVGRLQHERKIPYSHCNDLKLRLAWNTGQ